MKKWLIHFVSSHAWKVQESTDYVLDTHKIHVYVFSPPGGEECHRGNLPGPFPTGDPPPCTDKSQDYIHIYFLFFNFFSSFLGTQVSRDSVGLKKNMLIIISHGDFYYQNWLLDENFYNFNSRYGTEWWTILKKKNFSLGKFQLLFLKIVN